MNKKKILIMGANPETVSLILKAKDMGLYTIVTDYDPHAYAKQFADKAENKNECVMSHGIREVLDYSIDPKSAVRLVA